MTAMNNSIMKTSHNSNPWRAGEKLVIVPFSVKNPS